MGELLLIIEDNAQNHYMMSYLLQHNGFNTIVAEDGTAGIEAALQHRPAGILLDIQLPGMDGYAVAAELKRHPQREHTPIIAVTSYAMVGDREKILTAGARGYIEKPINPDTFADQIKYYLAGADS
jgi:CheY-like chemotaxis protein